MESRPYGAWTRRESDARYYRGRRGPSRDRRPRRSRRGPRYDRLLLVGVGVALILFSAGLVFTDVRKAGNETVSTAPKSDTMHLTVPSMDRVKNVPVYGAPVSDEAAMHDGTLHVDGTGFPWQKDANVYIAGHRVGYPRTDSFLVFWDLNKLKTGRRVILTDSDNTRYVYKVFRRIIVGPHDVAVKRPVEGENIVSLQTCTLPNYSQRLIVQARLVKTVKAPPAQQASKG